MSDAVTDRAAIIFMASFYRAIGFGRSVQNAFDQAKVALLLEGIQEENTPELFCKPDVDPSMMFLIEPPTADTRRSTTTSIHIGEIVMGNQTKKNAGRDFFEHVENSKIKTGGSTDKGE
ncbi:MAG: hypothetical protein GY801_39070 [bacterium]|nr:hypothetical protein [bacterium]